MSAASHGHGVSMPTPAHVRIIQASPAESAPTIGPRTTPRVDALGELEVRRRCR